MNRLMFGITNWNLCDEAGSEGGGAAPAGGGEGGASGGASGAITGNPAAEGGAGTPPAGGGGAGEAQPKNGGGEAKVGEEGAEGALTGKGEQPVAIDWEKITDEEYIKQLTAPEGQQLNPEIMKAYAPLLRECKVDPKVFEKFLAKDAELSKAAGEKRSEELKAKREEAQAKFKEAGEDFRKEFNPQQVKEMNETLSKIDDDTFKTIVTKSPLANNKTLGKMILAYRKVYGEDSVPTGGTSGQEKTFEQVWTGKA